MTDTRRTDEFVALGRPGIDGYAGLETFPNPGVARVEMTSDELTAVCPITGQPDLYVATIEFRNEGMFCEALAVRIRDDVTGALEVEPDAVCVTLEQKSRGGITITATA